MQGVRERQVAFGYERQRHLFHKVVRLTAAYVHSPIFAKELELIRTQPGLICYRGKSIFETRWVDVV